MDRILAMPQVTQSTSEFPRSINATSTRGSDSKARKCKTKFDGIDRFKMFKDVVLKAVGNLYGHRPAGNNYRREFAEVVVNKMVPLCVLCNLCFTTCLMVYLSPMKWLASRPIYTRFLGSFCRKSLSRTQPFCSMY